MAATHGTTGPWSGQRAQRACPPASHFTDVGAHSMAATYSMLTVHQAPWPRPVICRLIQSSPQPGVGQVCLPPFYEGGKQRPREAQARARSHSATHLQAQALPRGSTTCVRMFTHVNAFLWMCLFAWRWVSHTCKPVHVIHGAHLPTPYPVLLRPYPGPLSKELLRDWSLSGWGLSGVPQS